MTGPRRRAEELRLALMLLTRLPVGRLVDPPPPLSAARWAYPLAGLPVGALGWAVLSLALAAGAPPLAAALLALGGMALVTGGLHHDGLADLADGLGGGRDRPHILDVMRDSRIGSYGVLALVFIIGVEAAALGALGPDADLGQFLFAAAASRLAMLCASGWMPPARDDGLGHSAAGGLGRAWAPGTVLCLALGLLLGPPALAAALVATLAVAAVAARVQSRLGGQTGDVLGAVQRIAEVAMWLTFAAG
ncbi:Cobalamin synthase [Roseivivax jejudonensis]|uniref:Adenosylcobinamide-GDP ribazoletransferase n=1 Tax=Roseivivax jejudonensis TaxID=1529041 RepID=A0A1X6ZM82_9RHOB|nr:adenosylcobinamide-GDP ribazoletransferase [Roseivivax jejudonensis]SLN55655.1 Cobalamin synthase [Roseivivax jejudonensis]